MRFRLWLLVFGVVPLAAITTPTYADTVTANWVGLTYGTGGTQIVTITDSYLGVNETVYAGPFDWHRTDSPGPGVYPRTGLLSVPVDFKTFCIDVLSNVVSSQTFTTGLLTDAPLDSSSLTGLISPARAGLIGALYDRIGSVVSSVSAGGFQLALWELIFENEDGSHAPNAFNVTTGEFRMSGNNGVRDSANTFLSGLVPAGYTDVLALISSGQDQAYLLPVAASVVPLPSAVVAGLPILMLLGAQHWKRRRQSGNELGEI